jgi:hypothetical protein
LIYGGTQLTAGAHQELRRLWETAGSPEGDYNKYLQKITNAY